MATRSWRIAASLFLLFCILLRRLGMLSHVTSHYNSNHGQCTIAILYSHTQIPPPFLILQPFHDITATLRNNSDEEVTVRLGCSYLAIWHRNNVDNVLLILAHFQDTNSGAAYRPLTPLRSGRMAVHPHGHARVQVVVWSQHDGFPVPEWHMSSLRTESTEAVMPLAKTMAATKEMRGAWSGIFKNV